MARMNKWDKQHQRNTVAYERQIDEIFKSAAREAALLAATAGVFSPDKPFSFADYPVTRKRLEKLLSGLKTRLSAVIVNGVNSEWTLANSKNNELANQVFGDNVGKLSEEQYRKYYKTNDKARNAFLERKEAGMNLSDRVWRYTEQFKEEIELGIDIGLRDGLSADELSRELRQYLRYPDKLFRRVRDEHGNLVLSQAAKAFHPGQGVYRSSYKNARRLAATETNMAYRTADFERWQQLDFIVGIEIKLSNNHTLNGVPFEDICDFLKGKYPKDFKFVGWHPHCRCHAITILKTDEEIAEDNRRILAGQEPSEGSVNTVQDVPKQFKGWLDDNSERISRHKSAPYFLKDNPKYTGVRSHKNGVGAVTGTKLGRSATKDAFKEYESSNPTVLTKEQKAQTAEMAKALGLKEHNPMTFFEADEGRANVNYGKGISFSENCQCCVAIHEARLRGLNLTAIGYSEGAGSVTVKLGDRFQDIWVNAKTGKTPQVTMLKADTESALFDKLEKAMTAKGRYHVGINFNDNTGHVITAERLESGRLLFYDAQSGDFLNIREYTTLESFEVLKVDKLIFKPEMLREISQVI